MTSGRLVRRIAAVLAVLVAGPGLALGPAPAASAATCTSAGGVSVVVDYRELGGSTVTACAADGGGKSAAAIFASVGVSITYATRQPGFVCRVNGVPTSDPCVNTSPANAYWGLWWADGSRGSWTYSSSGVGTLTVPAGGSVGWSWQQDRTAGTSVPPAVAPPVTRSATPSPTPTPSSTSTPSPTATPSSGGGTTGGSGTGSGTGSGSGSGTGSGSGNSTGGGSGSGSTGSAGGTGAPQPSPSSTPSSSGSSATPSPSPSVSAGAGTDARRKPGSRTSAPAEAGGRKVGSGGATDDPSEESSPSPSTEASATVDPNAPASDAQAAAAPEKVPAAVTWGVVGLLAAALAGAALVARRRRGV